MIRIAICDDSLTDADYIKHLCLNSRYKNELTVSHFSKGSELIDNISQTAFDIVYLAIKMRDSSGLSIGKMINQIAPQAIIIFVTRYPEYALEAYDCQAFHYLIKPCERKKFYQVLNRAIGKLNISEKYHLIKSHGKSIKIKISDIYYIECYKKHIIYHTKNERIESKGTMSETYNILQKHGFHQVHQGYIVNFEKVKCFNPTFLLLDNDSVVMISVRKRKETMLAYSSFLENYT